MEGSLSKWTNVVKGWQYRWFVLDVNSGLLSYYTSREKMVRGVRRGCVRLKGAVIGIDDQEDSTFTITVDSKTFHFQAKNSLERETWVNYLQETILRHAYGIRTPAVSTLRLSHNTGRVLPTLEEFDRNLAEADAYLQILINRCKILEEKMSTMNDEDKSKCDVILKETLNMLEQVKHTIVLLQIAKNTAYPVNGNYQPVRRHSVGIDNQDYSAGLDLASEVVELAGFTPISDSAIVPEISYSSSDEEDFFDAVSNDEEYAEAKKRELDGSPGKNIPSLNNGKSVNSTNNSAAAKLTKRSYSEGPQRSSTRSVTSSSSEDGADDSSSLVYNAGGAGSNPRVVNTSSSHKIPLHADSSIDFDAIYEDPSDTEINMESQSVVTHLISQVKIGMDLTKVVLPTFILERRSLLEMYADYFAHPDIFLKATELTSERDRMVQIVKWYMASFHAGRKSAVAKKPYNPILGEIFRCHWDLSEDGSGNEEVVTDGPVPWCKSNQLTFIAEQVSHHPPISAFYAEHVDKRVSLCAHVWTKSKFLGLSIGVHNVGHGTVRLHDHNEEYTCTFPNGYGRSILTVPWIELGGSTTIKCPQSGYQANVEFHTKPFYGGKKHRITTEVFAPNEKKPFLTVTGEWNGAMEAKWADGRTETFIDVSKLPISKKIVRRIDEQEENESRNIWKEVTLGLKYNDIEHATNAKSAVEQRQREGAAERLKNNKDWTTQYFEKNPHDDSYLYKNTLERRLAHSS